MQCLWILPGHRSCVSVAYGRGSPKVKITAKRNKTCQSIIITWNLLFLVQAMPLPLHPATRSLSTHILPWEKTGAHEDASSCLYLQLRGPFRFMVRVSDGSVEHPCFTPLGLSAPGDFTDQSRKGGMSGGGAFGNPLASTLSLTAEASSCFRAPSRTSRRVRM